MSWIMKPASPRHLPEILRIEEETFPDPWSEHMLISCIANPTVLFPVAIEGEGILGFAVLQLIGPEAELQNIAVDKEAKRRGIGRGLLTHLIQEGEARGVEAFHLEVRASNEAAIALYGALGFQAAGLRRDYYQSPPEDALIMTRRRMSP